DLSWLYREMGCLDLALKHLRTYRQLVQKSGHSPERRAPLHDQVDRSDFNLNDLAEKILEKERKYGEIAQGLRVLDSAALAIQLGLAGKALDLLLESDIAAFGQQGMILELELLLKTGRVKEVREWTGGQQAGKAKAMLGEISFFWF